MKIEVKNHNKLKSDNKPVETLNAPTNKVCGLGATEFGSYEWSVKVEERLSKESKELANLFVLQYESGCRISEILSIKYNDILRDNTIKIKGKKGSNDRIISSSRIAKWLSSCRRSKRNPFETFDRFYVYRLYKKVGISFQSVNSSKKSITHSLRQLKVQAIREVDNSAELISQSIGQKNSKNSKFYGKEKRKQ